MDPRLHGPERDVEQLRDLVVVELLDVAQHERLHQLGVVGAEDLERVEQVEAAAGDHAGGAWVGVHRQLVGEPLGRAPLQGAVGRAGAVGRDGVQPRGEPAPAAEGVDLRGHQEQRVLGRLLGVLVEEQHPPADPSHARLDLGQQLLQREPVAVGGPHGQLVELVRLHAFTIGRPAPNRWPAGAVKR